MGNALKIAFAGTPEFAKVALEKIIAAGFDVPLVLTQPDRPAGRGMSLQASPVKAFAISKNIKVIQPQGLKLDGKYQEDANAAKSELVQTAPDVLVVAAYGLILPQWVLELPRLGCLNIHASLLPRWRGAAPIHRAIEAGDKQTGICIMQMDEGLDTGDILLTEKTPITPQDTTTSLHDKLASLGGRLIVEALEIATCGKLSPMPQAMEGINYAHKISKSEAAINWQDSAEQIERRMRAFNPFPACTVSLSGVTYKCFQSSIVPAPEETDLANIKSGEIIKIDDAGVYIKCADQKILRLEVLQRAGGKKLPAAAFLAGIQTQNNPWKIGQIFDAAE